MINGIKKGKAAERELLNLLQATITSVYQQRGYKPPELKRTSYMQSDSGGYDITGIDWLALEVKRCEKLQLPAWWEQAKKQAGPGQIAVLAYRQNRCAWRFRMAGLIKVSNTRALQALVDISFASFLEWLRLRCEADLDAFEAACKQPVLKGLLDMNPSYKIS